MRWCGKAPPGPPKQSPFDKSIYNTVAYQGGGMSFSFQPTTQKRGAALRAVEVDEIGARPRRARGAVHCLRQVLRRQGGFVQHHRCTALGEELRTQRLLRLTAGSEGHEHRADPR